MMLCNDMQPYLRALIVREERPPHLDASVMNPVEMELAEMFLWSAINWSYKGEREKKKRAQKIPIRQNSLFKTFQKTFNFQ